MKKNHTQAFSLIELIVVIGIIGLILAISVPGIMKFGSLELRDKGYSLKSQLELAKQTAIATSKDVEVRIFKKNSSYDSLQLFQYNKYGKMQRITNLVNFKTVPFNKNLSTVILQGESESGEKKEESGSKSEQNYISFRFKPDGSINLPNKFTKSKENGGGEDSWYLTLVNKSKEEVTSIPKSFYCLQIIPRTGSLFEYME